MGVPDVMMNEEIKRKAISHYKPNTAFCSSKVEKKFGELLDNVGIKHKVRKIFENYVDFCIEVESGHRLIIMVDGEYWHNLDGDPTKKPLKTIFEASGDRDFGRLAKFFKDKLFNLECKNDRNISLLRFKTSDIKRSLSNKEPPGFYYACGDIAIIDDFMKKLKLICSNNN